jgi:hypothetical protein
MQLAQIRRGVGVGGGVAMGLPLQVRLEDFVHHVDVVESANGGVDCTGMLLRIDRSQRVEQFVVGPGLLREQ